MQINGKLIRGSKINGVLVGVEPTPPIPTDSIIFTFDIMSTTLNIKAVSTESHNCVVDWGDGTIENKNTKDNLSHTYTDTGVKTVKIKCSEVTALSDTMKARTDLISVILPDNITSVVIYGFYNCPNLTNVVLSKNLHKTPTGMFQDCINLQTIDISNITDFGQDTFENCTNLSIEVTFADNVTHIGYGAFKKSGITKVNNFPYIENQYYVEDYIFDTCKNLQSVNLDNINYFSNYMFDDCTNLKTVYIGDKCKVIRGRAFYNCTNVETITINKAENDIVGIEYKPWGATNATVKWIG